MFVGLGFSGCVGLMVVMVVGGFDFGGGEVVEFVVEVFFVEPRDLVVSGDLEVVETVLVFVVGSECSGVVV